MKRYQNRKEAGQVLAGELQQYRNKEDVLVLALPRGGVPVGYEVAVALHVPLDVFIVRKLGVPWHNELAMGALAMGNTIVLNNEIIARLNITDADLKEVVGKEMIELKRREFAYRDDLPFPKLENKIVILVDDGIATGATMRAAIKALRALNPAKLVVAVPVADKDLCDEIGPTADQFVCPLKPMDLQAVGLWYVDFSQTEDDEVFRLLQSARKYSVST